MIKTFSKLNLYRQLNFTRILYFSNNCPNFNYLKDISKTPSEILTNLTKSDEDKLEYIKELYKTNVDEGKIVDFTLTDFDLIECLLRNKNDCLRYFGTRHKKFMKRSFSKSNEPAEKFSPLIKLDKRFGMFISQNMKILKKRRMSNAILLDSQKVIIDMGFEHLLTARENLHTVKQVHDSLALCMCNRDPFQVLLANCHPYSEFNRIYQGKLNAMDKIPFQISTLDFDEIFPEEKDNIIYLSPNSDKEFQQGEYNRNAIFVIGGIVDKSHNCKNITIQKAKKHGVKHAKLPLSRGVQWVSGSKYLPLKTVFEILYQARATNGDWNHAIRETIPRRFTTEKSKH